MPNKVGICALRREKAPSPEEKAHIRRCAEAAMSLFPGEYGCRLQVLYTDDRGIATVNLEQRGVDAPTDVLSFPAFEISKGDRPVPDPDTGLVYLGDIVISLVRANAQAAEYGHSEARELGYLTVHGVLHLLGYDHERPEDAEKMRRAEEDILGSLGIAR